MMTRNIDFMASGKSETETRAGIPPPHRQIDHVQIIREPDVDLLLCEEIAVTPDFAGWLASQVLGASHKGLVVSGAWTHLTDQFGECDILVLLQGKSTRIALLIENKISEGFQPRQCERYLERGRNGALNQRWDTSTTLLVAPEGYSQTNLEAKKFEAFISYESIRDWFAQRGDIRSQWRARALNGAIEQSRKGYVKRHDPRVTALWKSYWAYRAAHFPQIAMPEPGSQGYRNGWPKLGKFHDRDGVKLVHKLASGCVDLVIMHTSRDDLIARLLDIGLPANAKINQTGKSAVVRIEVPVVDYRGEFEPQVRAVHEGLCAAAQLLHFYQNAGHSRLIGEPQKLTVERKGGIRQQAAV